MGSPGKEHKEYKGDKEHLCTIGVVFLVFIVFRQCVIAYTI